MLLPPTIFKIKLARGKADKIDLDACGRPQGKRRIERGNRPSTGKNGQNRCTASARQTENRERKSAFNGQKRPKPLSGVRKAVWKSLYFPAFERGIEKGRGKSALKEMVGRMSIIANFSLQRLGTFWGCEGK